MFCIHKWNLTTKFIKTFTPKELWFVKNSIRTCQRCGKKQTLVMTEDTSKAPGNYIVKGWK